MSSLEKYYNHIIDHMFKHVEFHNDEHKQIYFIVKLMPIWTRNYPSDYDFFDFVNDWDDYLEGQFGVRPSDMEVLRKLFLKRIKREYS